MRVNHPPAESSSAISRKHMEISRGSRRQVVAGVRELKTLRLLIKERRELRDLALALGTRLYAEKPSESCGRLAGYWETWWPEKKSITRAAERK